MPELTYNERIDIIAVACELEQDLGVAIEGARGPGSFQGAGDIELAVALDVIALNGGADDIGGDAEFSRHGARVGRTVLWVDSQGFKTVEIYADSDSAYSAIERADDEARANVPEED